MLRVFAEPECDILEGATSMFTDQVALEVVACITATSRGHRHLLLIHRLLQTNRLWLLQQLDIPPPLSKNKASGKEISIPINLLNRYICTILLYHQH
jgi:hypothetical protein